jgi:hypothetical protein
LHDGSKINLESLTVAGPELRKTSPLLELRAIATRCAYA